MINTIEKAKMQIIKEMPKKRKEQILLSKSIREKLIRKQLENKTNKIRQKNIKNKIIEEEKRDINDFQTMNEYSSDICEPNYEISVNLDRRRSFPKKSNLKRSQSSSGLKHIEVLNSNTNSADSNNETSILEINEKTNKNFVPKYFSFKKHQEYQSDFDADFFHDEETKLSHENIDNRKPRKTIQSFKKTSSNNFFFFLLLI